MLTKKERWFALLFLVLVSIDLVVGSSENLQHLRYATKPSILISLILFFIQFSSGLSGKIKVLTIGGLFFSLVGDVALLFDSVSDIYFLIGLSGFLTAHIFYVFLFLVHRNKQRNLIGFAVLVLLLAGSVFLLLLNTLNELLIPVIIYIIAISFMVVTAYSRKGMVNKTSYLLVLIGAILFLISDSFLAINKFKYDLPLSHLLVMGTYSFAQIGITLGILKLKK